MGSPLGRKARDGIEVTFAAGDDTSEEPDPVRFVAWPVGRGRYLGILAEHEPDDDEGDKTADDAGMVRALLGLLEVDDDGALRPVTGDEVEDLSTGDDWSAGEVAQLLAAVRLANEGGRGTTGKASRTTPTGSESSGLRVLGA